MPTVLAKYSPPDVPLDVLFEDDTLLVLNKPSGLLSVPGKADDHKDCMESRAKAIFPDALLIHRLDMETSGVFLMARTKEAQRHLGLQFEHRNAKKTYIARVWGTPRDREGQIDLPLICDWPNRPKQMVDHEKGKKAITNWSVLAGESIGAIQVTRMELKPETGRSHQLRVHMLAIGHPILGDQLYAPEEALKAAPRLQLHAKSLTILHPDKKDFMTFEAEIPF